MGSNPKHVLACVVKAVRDALAHAVWPRGDSRHQYTTDRRKQTGGRDAECPPTQHFTAPFGEFGASPRAEEVHQGHLLCTVLGILQATGCVRCTRVANRVVELAQTAYFALSP